MRLGLFWILVLAVLAVLAPSLVLSTTNRPPGSFSPTPLTSELSAMLYTSLHNLTAYTSSVTARICVKDISLVEVASAASWNYRFTTTGCDVPLTLMRRQGNGPPKPIPLDIFGPLGQCTPDFARDCAEIDAVVIMNKRFDASILVWSIETTPRTSVPMTGGWSFTPRTPELTTLLYTSLANEALYDKTVKARVCVTAIFQFERQVVAGMNYRFTATGCDVPRTLQQQSKNQQQSKIATYLGQCKAAFARNCVAVDAVATLYKALDGSVRVTAIATVPKAPARVHAPGV